MLNPVRSRKKTMNITRDFSNRIKPMTGACLLALAGLLTSVHPAAAQTTVIGFTPGAYGATDNAADAGVSSYSLGFEFTANSNVFVTSLGYFNDPSFDPRNPFNTVSLSPEPAGSYSYASDHQVGLYQVVPGVGMTVAESGLLLGQTTITSAGTANGDFLYNAITPIALVAGDQYVIAGVTGARDPYLYNAEDDSTTQGGVGLTVNQSITYDQDRYAVSSTLAYAGSTDPGSEPGFFGPNFQISNTLPTSAAPEPGEWAVLGLATLGFGTLVLRARCRQAAALPQ